MGTPAKDVGFGVFDTDNHYYETRDAFSRHLDPRFRDRTLRWAEVDGRMRLIVGGRVSDYMPNPTFDPISKPGWLSEYFRGADPDKLKAALEQLDPLDSHPEYQQRDARLRLMDEQGLDAAFFFPTLAVGMERALLHDPQALMAAFHAFNRWVEEDWGFAYRDRVFAAPFISLVDADWAVEELEYALERGARTVLVTYGPVVSRCGHRSHGDAVYDPFWARVNEAGITVVFHGGETRYDDYLHDWGKRADVNIISAARRRLRSAQTGGGTANEDAGPVDVSEGVGDHLFRHLLSHSAIADTVAELLTSRLFFRFPRLRVAAIETGSAWVRPLMARLRQSFERTPQEWVEDPTETMRRHVWVAAFGEDDLEALRADLGGAERVLVGSDWPHPEGYAHPLDVIDDLRQFHYSDDECRLVMRDNGFHLATVLAA